MNQEQNKKKEQQQNDKPYISALEAADVYRSPTAAVRPNASGAGDSTGTKVDYTTPTAPGGGGAAGTGEASGQSATGASITTTSPDEIGQVGKHYDKPEGEDNVGTPPPANQSGGATNAGKMGER